MPGGKKLAVSKLLEVGSTSDTNVPTVQCKFCQSSAVKNGSRMKTHVEKCISCPKLVKDKYLAELRDSITNTTENDRDEASEIEARFDKNALATFFKN